MGSFNKDLLVFLTLIGLIFVLVFGAYRYYEYKNSSSNAKFIELLISTELYFIKYNLSKNLLCTESSHINPKIIGTDKVIVNNIYKDKLIDDCEIIISHHDILKIKIETNLNGEEISRVYYNAN